MKRQGALPRLGFLGTGWIGRHRLESIHRSGEAEIVAIADLNRENALDAAQLVPKVRVLSSLDDLLELDLDGVVIATPSAGHGSQAERALEKGMAVFCQKPLGRNAAETVRVVDASRRADRLLGVDFCYRFTDGMERIHSMVQQRKLGEVFAADLVFHNAYGPDKPWFYDAELSGGGCLMDLGSHLVDLALWLFDYPEIRSVGSSIYAKGERLKAGSGQVEDYAAVSLCLEGGSVVRIACSWNVSAGQDAVISCNLYGTDGGASFRNVDGSFYDFVAEHFRGTSRRTLATPPDDWGGRAAVTWCRRLRRGHGFDPESEQLVRVAAALDAAYGR
ncbi:Gfo/Idh/MocA family oxidoreductase [Geomonas sp. Red875]|uniref:Gfo/Idh/MocA family oxidoreductase n=1 Tax=Geomesophilobacter sediminis TaxID=2798584 RepID=A0A8J7LZ41_9BACT|nr:Gfo/Idh/MocA family oxidoreductase [Geomesophilobacter sediminis]